MIESQSVMKTWEKCQNDIHYATQNERKPCLASYLWKMEEGGFFLNSSKSTQFRPVIWVLGVLNDIQKWGGGPFYLISF